MRTVLRSGEPFAFAGLWSVWRNADGVRAPSCAIVTTTPNEVIAPIHDRMPVGLSREAESLWLDGDVRDADTLSRVEALSRAPDGGL